MPRQNWTEDDLKAAKIRMGKGGVVGRPEGRKPWRAPDPAHARPSTVEGTRSTPSPPYRSKLEAAWANHLDHLKAATVFDGWRYEPMNFRLPGKKNFYKVDFIAWRGRLVTYFEVKGRNKSDDRSLVKLKTTAGLHPWAAFIQVKRINGNWEEREIA